MHQDPPPTEAQIIATYRTLAAADANTLTWVDPTRAPHLATALAVLSDKSAKPLQDALSEFLALEGRDPGRAETLRAGLLSVLDMAMKCYSALGGDDRVLVRTIRSIVNHPGAHATASIHADLRAARRRGAQNN